MTTFNDCIEANNRALAALKPATSRWRQMASKSTFLISAALRHE
ncbi:MAG TPA: hypothetical protein VFF81_11575 [Noviherbaspirillum sp.]|nr:hypothetical protein [Noviherbaspirillum sp.]